MQTEKKIFIARKGGPTRPRLFSKPIHQATVMYVVVTFPEPEHSPAIKGLGDNVSF